MAILSFFKAPFRKKVVLMGGGRLAGIIYSTFRGRYDFIGYVDDVYDKAYVEEKFGLKKLGTSEDIPRIAKTCRSFVVSIGSIGDNSARTRYFKKLKDMSLDLPALIADSAIIGDGCFIGQGSIIQNRVIVDATTRIGENCLIASGSVIRHDIEINDNVVIAPGVILNGEVKIGDGAFLGTGSIVIQRISVGKGAVVGAGACVINDVPDMARVVGLPARPIG